MELSSARGLRIRMVLLNVVGLISRCDFLYEEGDGAVGDA